MAKLRSGILGNVRGKVAGVVGSQWKNINYVREYIKPANPNTAGQQVQRTKMTDVVAFAKPLVGSVFNVYTDKFIKNMSGFNFFIKRNIAEFDGTPDFSAIKLSEGKLSPVATLAVTYNAGDGETILTWAQNIGNNGAGADKCFWLIYNETSEVWYYADAEVIRSDVGDTQTLPTGLTATDLHCYVIAAQETSGVLTLISDSVYDAVAAP